MLFLGCQVGDIGAADNNNTGGGGDDTGDGSGNDSCAPEAIGPQIDPSMLTACCPDNFTDGAHCVPGSFVPDTMKDMLMGCENNGYCVPDKFIESGGAYVPPTCTSVAGVEGRCLSACIPQVYDNYGLLPQDTCDNNERCVPCISPIDNQPTGACEIAECEGDGGGGGGTPTEPACPYTGPDLLDPSTLPACNLENGGEAHCLTTSLVPAEFAARLADCDATSKCVPDDFIRTGGNFIPATCESVAGAEGRCLSMALPEVQEQAALIPQATCSASEKCVPCFNPLDGSDTGACRLSCDPGPTEGPNQLPACCEGRGTCVPPSAAGEQADFLGEDTCETGLLCAPNVFVNDPNYQPTSCETGFISLLFGDEFKPGVCLPECLPDVDNFLIGQDGCQEGMKCAPCLDPLSGEPTGACEL